MSKAVETLLSVCLSRPTGRSYMIVLPEGVRQAVTIRRTLEGHYGAARHGDLKIVEPQDGLIGVDTARSLPEFSFLSPGSAADKTLLILDGHCLNRPAANALLKLLEEPSRHMRVLMTTDRPHLVPATIVSRMLRLLVPPSDALFMDEMNEADETDANEKDRRDALALTGNNPGSASRLLGSGMLPWFVRVRAWLDDPAAETRPEMPDQAGTRQDASMLGAVLQTILRDTMIAALPGGVPGTAALPSWTADQAFRGFRMLQTRASDMDRRSLDLELRAHALLTELSGIRLS